jgi:hypothetical protein
MNRPDKLECLSQPSLIFVSNALPAYIRPDWKGYSITNHLSVWCHDTQHNDIQHNDIQYNDTQHNDTQHNDTQPDRKYR